MSSPLPTEISLWDFSLYHYVRPGVSDCCLLLQDEHGANVNLIFWALWLGHRDKHLDAQLLTQARAAINEWDCNYVLPLRQLRRRMKMEFGAGDKSIEAVRERIKQAELLAEKYMQELLERIGGISDAESKTPREIMQQNLGVYLQSLGITEAAADHLLRLIE